MRRLLPLLIATALLPALPAQAAKNTRPSLVSAVEFIPPGQTFWVALRLEMNPEWHVYWKNPGDSGLPNRIRWTLPEGFTAGELQWPAPQRIPAGPLVSYGYEHEVLHPVQITAPAGLKAGETVTLKARVDWLECKEACLPGRADLQLVLPVGEARVSAEWAPRIEKARADLPAPGPAATLHRDGDGYVLAIPGAAPGKAELFVETAEAIDYAADPVLARTSDGWRMALRPAQNAKPFERLAAVLVADGRAFAIDAPLTTTSAPAATGMIASPPRTATASSRGPGSLLVALLFAFGGGLILNLMPCVLPVLSLKVMSIVKQSGQDRGTAFRHGLAFTAGALAFFWLLAGSLLALRAGGEQIGWGFQLQSPPVVAGLAILFFLIGLNLFGVFEVGESLTTAGGLVQGRKGYGSSFFGGALATITATPCTAPFMGSALGFALTQPAWAALLVFTFLGLGMATPYLLLASFPALLRFVPRPGAWMEVFKQFMGFLMMGTVVVLAWVFGRQVGVNGMTLLLSALVMVGLGAWMFGMGRRSEAPGRRFASALSAAALVAGGLALVVTQAQPAPAASSASVSTGTIVWEPFSPEKVAQARAAGKPVFLDFTADWCLTCQVNERVAFGSAEVQARFRDKGIVALRADWTLKDDAITRTLEGFGRQGVPLYVLYAPGKEAPLLLPEVVTPGIVLQALDTLG
jgi:thiol:disulfide interchange protein DsbD